jgi:hypothetical protein
VGDLTAGPLTPIARIGAEALNRNFDFDGARVAWVREDCRRSSLTVRALDDQAPVGRSGVACPISVAPRPRLGRDGAIRLRISCPNGCRGTVTIYGPGRLQTRARAFDLAAGGPRTVHVALTARQRVALTRQAPVSVKLKLRTAGPTRFVRRTIVAR